MDKLWIKDIESDYKKWSELLINSSLKPELNLDETYGIFEDEKLIATGSIFENILKCIAIDPSYKGGSVFNELISELINKIYYKGYDSIYVYTKPDSAKSFEYLGFQKIETVKDKLVFLEKSSFNFKDFISELKDKNQFSDKAKIGSIVMNANPFTKGHLYLVEKAKEKCDFLHIFILREEKSVFPYQVRKELVEKATSHLKNIFIHSTGNYMISSKTFPSYFLKENEDIIKIQAILDSKIFKNSIAPALNITHRFVGEEPFSPTTKIYNDTMKEIFSCIPNPLKLIIIPRIKNNNIGISASRVRKLIYLNRIKDTSDLLPKTSYDFLNSSEASSIIEKIKNDPLEGQKKSDIK